MSDTTASGATQSLGIGSIISESFSLSFANFFKLLAVIIIPYILMGVAGFLLLGSMLSPDMLSDQVALEQVMADPTFLVMYFLFLVIMVFISSFMIAAATKVIFDAKTGGSGSLGAAFSVGFSRAVQLFVTMLVLYIGIVIVFAIFGAIFGVLAGATGVGAIGIVAMIAIVVAALWVMGAIMPFTAVVVLENRWVSAIGRSFSLTKGYRWWNVLLVVLFSLVLIVFYIVVALVGGVATMLGTVGFVLAAIVAVVAMVIIVGAMTGMYTLDYARLREIKEGTSLGAIGDVFD
ncbi:MAG: hypothetical protein AAF557_24000 [Pseudomonadota bacterium]